MADFMQRATVIHRLMQRLIQVRVGETISYEDIDRVIGPGKRYYLTRARTLCNQEHGAIFEPVYREGLIRIKSAEAATIGKKARRRIRRTAAKAINEIGNAITMANDATNEQILEAAAEQRILGLHVQLSHESNVKKEIAEILIQKESLADSARAALDNMRGALNRGRRRKEVA